eukprot:scaffold234656_cov53-Attheya_sp.AAC.2
MAELSFYQGDGTLNESDTLTIHMMHVKCLSQEASKEESNGDGRRTRMAQSFADVIPDNPSFYREHQVSKKEFCKELIY